MTRINWLDTCRGTAILLLILVHYIGALESRGFISYDFLIFAKALLRVATPYFILIFGFTFAICYLHKLDNFSDVKRLYVKIAPKLLLVLIAREIIVLSTALRDPNMGEKIWDVLLYRDFSASGEILTFYFFAIFMSPIFLFLLKKIRASAFFLFAIIIYMVGYGIGESYSQDFTDLWFRFLFYDVYAFFPFFSLVMVGMILSQLYQGLSQSKFKVFASIAILSFTAGSILICVTNVNPIYALATAELKNPPQLSYMLFYLGLAIITSIIIIFLSNVSSVLKYLSQLLDIIGRNSLLAYVLHYYLFISTPLGELFLGKDIGPITELVLFMIMIMIMLGVIILRDSQKRVKSADLKIHNFIRQ